MLRLLSFSPLLFGAIIFITCFDWFARPLCAQPSAGDYFYSDAESYDNGAPLPQPPFFPSPWKPPDAPHPGRGYIAEDPSAPQGEKIFFWNIPADDSHDHYHEIRFDRLPPTEEKDFYLAFFVRFDRIAEQDIRHDGAADPEAESWDKAVEIRGDGLRWTISFGERGMGNPKHRFSVFVCNPDYHLNRDKEVWDSYYQNLNGYSRSNAFRMDYETWHSVVFKLRWALDRNGEIGLWIDGRKVMEYSGIRTVQAPGTFERLQMWGTIARPAYDAPPHIRKMDALLFTDDFQRVIDGGYLASPSQPVVAAVSGTVMAGEILTLSGSRLQDEAKTDWDRFFVQNSTAWSFEGGRAGENIGADGYGELGYGVSASGVYDDRVAVLGSQSARFHIEGASSVNLEDYSIIDPVGGPANDLWIRMYVRWHLEGAWPDSHIKMVMCANGFPDSYYFQPACSVDGLPPEQMTAVYDSQSHSADIPGGRLQNDRWYCVEVHWKSDVRPYVFDAWMDGQQIVKANPETQGPLDWLFFGLVNACCTTPGFSLDHWVDGFAVAKSRIYPSALVVLGNTPDYETARKRIQEPVWISDEEIRFKCDPSGLGGGPFYLWVVNNRQKRSEPFLLSEITGTAHRTERNPANERFEVVAEPNVPNPFNGSTAVSFTLMQPCEVDVSVYDLAGRRLCRLMNDRLMAGKHRLRWNAIDEAGQPLASGIYFVAIRAGQTALFQKVTLVR